MTSISTKKSVLGIVVQTSEGIPKAPSAATEYIALRDDWDFSPSFGTLENGEVKNSIGRAKPIIAGEDPTASGSAYLRHSGVEGQAPNFGPLLKAFFGDEIVAGTQYDTDAASTTSTLKVPSGDAANFQRGQGLLIKDGVNGHRIRAVHASNGTTDLELSFALPFAPAASVNLGKSVLYKPADEGHQALTLWHYLGNGGAVEMLADARVTGFSFDATANELLDASFDFEALGYYFDPIEITASTRYIDFTDDDGTVAAAVNVGWYKDPHELAAAIQAAMAALTTETITVEYLDASGKFKFGATGAVFSLLFSSGANTANTIATKIGFAVADSTGSLTYTGANTIAITAPQAPSYDDASPLAVKNQEVMFGDQADYACFDASSVSFSGSLSRAVRESICAESGRKGSRITAREGEITVSGELQQYEAKNFHRFREGSVVRFQYNFGTKTGGNWNPGVSGGLYVPSATITAYEIGEDEGVATFEMTLQPFVDDAGAGEMYLFFQ